MIGVFDSGVGGLTVISWLRRLLPNESIFYLGDTARVPYGSKSKETIIRYALEISSFLVQRGAKLIIVACNTASAVALPVLQSSFRVPIRGVTQAGALAALAVSSSGRIGVIGTRTTIASKVYEKIIHAFSPNSLVFEKACPLLVPLIEEGMLDHPITEATLHFYLDFFLDKQIDSLVLGCTHYPLLTAAIGRIMGDRISIVDCGKNCALLTKKLLQESDLEQKPQSKGSLTVRFTDRCENVLAIVQEALDLELHDIKFVNLEHIA